MTCTNQQIGQWGPTQIGADIRIFPNGPPPGILMNIRVPGPPVHFSSNKDSDDIIITALPECWDINNWPSWEWEGCPSWDMEIIYELMDTVEEEWEENLDREIEKLSKTMWIENIFVHSGNWWSTRDHYVEVIDDEVSQILKDAEEDFDYEEWINSKQYKDSLKDYNKHKLLAWNKDLDLDEDHPKWSGEYSLLEQLGHLKYDLFNLYIKERYRVEVYVHTLCSVDTHYAKGSTPYGDVYIPNKIANYLKDFCGLYEMDIALQDVEGTKGKGPNAIPWTCVYLHNK